MAGPQSKVEPVVGSQPGEAGVALRHPDYPELQPSKVSGTTPSLAQPLDQLMGVPVTVTAELGRVSLTISEVLKLTQDSVIELDRAVTEPVDLIVQGVRLARGEVVVVGDRFAVRILEIMDPKKRGS
jgi:flagellar motor switch protein FliN/FliY